MSQEIFWMVLLGLLAVCVAFLVPLLLQLRRTALRAEQFLGQTEHDLVPLLKELRETSERAAKLARVVEEDFSRVAPLFRSLGEAGQSLHTLTGALNADLFRYAGSALGFWLGVRSMKKGFSSDKQTHKEGD
jgi:uncharacterized protein YoxC